MKVSELGNVVSGVRDEKLPIRRRKTLSSITITISQLLYRETDEQAKEKREKVGCDSTSLCFAIFRISSFCVLCFRGQQQKGVSAEVKEKAKSSPFLTFFLFLWRKQFHESLKKSIFTRVSIEGKQKQQKENTQISVLGQYHGQKNVKYETRFRFKQVYVGVVRKKCYFRGDFKVSKAVNFVRRNKFFKVLLKLADLHNKYV